MSTAGGLQASEISRGRRAAGGKPISHNLNGQRLGKKGRDTRARILAAADVLLAAPGGVPISLSAVAREASLGMTSLYNYFTDLTELLLAVLEPVMAEAEQVYVEPMRVHWPDATLGMHCHDFVVAFHGFWHRHSALLHLRNALSDQQDKRMMAARVHAAQPLIALLVRQMGQDPAQIRSPAAGMATVLYTGLERVVTVATDRILPNVTPGAFAPDVANFIAAEARLLELGIRDFRDR